jgi:hypothetical protein
VCSQEKKEKDMRKIQYALLSAAVFMIGSVAQVHSVDVPEILSKYGTAIVEWVRNETPYEMQFFYDPSVLADKLKDGMKIQLRAQTEGAGFYYRASKEGDTWKLRCDAKDKNDPATLFTINKEAGSIRLISEFAEGKALKANDKTYEVEFVAATQKDPLMFWTLEGENIDNCFLRNVKLSAYLSPRSAANKIKRLEAEIKEYEKDGIMEIVKAEYIARSAVARDRDTFGTKDVTTILRDKVAELKDKEGNVHPFAKEITLNALTVGGTEPEWIVGVSEGKGAVNSWMKKLFGVYYEGSPKLLRITFKTYGKDVIFEAWQDESNDGVTITANPNVNPDVKAKLEEIARLKDLALKGQVSSEEALGAVGYPGELFTTKTLFELITMEFVTAVEEEARGGGVVVRSGATADIKNVAASRNPEMRGNGIQVISGFGPEMLLVLQALYGGWAWLEESLAKPWSATVLFRAIAEDYGNVRIALSNEATPTSRYVIVLGDLNNTVSRIYKEGDVVYEEPAERNPLARVSPGILENIWVSINNGLIVVGKGEAGTGVIMAWRDTNPVPMINRIGFGSNLKPVRYTEVQKVNKPLSTQKPAFKYYSKAGNVPLGKFEKPLSPSDAGTVEFDASGSDLTVSMASADGKGYDLVLGAEIVLRRYNDSKAELIKIDAALTPGLKLPGHYWLSLYKGIVLAGKGEVGSNPFIIWYDGKLTEQDLHRNITDVIFAGNAQVSNVTLYPEIEIGFGEVSPTYVRTADLFDVTGALYVNAKYSYRLSQSKDQVWFMDLLGLGRWAIGKAPKPGAEYRFGVTVQKDGSPKLDLQGLEDSKAEIALRSNAYILDKTGDASFEAASKLAEAGGKGETITQAVTSVAAVLAAGGGIWAKADAARDDATLAEIQRIADRYVYTEDVVRSKSIAVVPQEAIDNSKRIETLLTEFDATKSKDLARAVDIMEEVVLRASHYYTVKDDARRKIIFDNIRELHDTIDRKPLEQAKAGKKTLNEATLDLYNNLLDVLVEAYDNPYLVDTTSEKEMPNKNNMYNWANSLVKELFANKQMLARGIEISSIEMMFPFKLDPVKYKNGVCVYFEARAGADVFVGFAKDPFRVRAHGSPMYEVGFGRWNNSMVTIARRSLGDAVIKFDNAKYPKFALRPDTFKKCWINIYKGTIQIGTEAADLKNKVAEWIDPYPTISISDVGFSKWYEDVTVRNAKVMPPLQEVKPKPAPKPKPGEKTVTPKPVTPKPIKKRAYNPRPDRFLGGKKAVRTKEQVAAYTKEKAAQKKTVVKTATKKKAVVKKVETTKAADVVTSAKAKVTKKTGTTK